MRLKMKTKWLILLGFLLITGCSESYDVVIKNGLVVDGAGNDTVRTDLAIRNGKIVATGKFDTGQRVGRIIDAQGLIVAPGFIDIHTHAERKLPLCPAAENYITQGVTTVIGGNCGGSPLPMGKYIRKVDSTGLAINLGLLVGHNTIRRKVMGSANRSPTPAELVKMKELVKQAMADGAFGLSTGLKYVPGAFSKTDEVVALAKMVAESGGIYATHMRDEGLGLIGAVREALIIGDKANIPVEISHLKAMGKSMWGSSKKVLAMIDSARAAGLDVTFDQYPYTATSTGLGVLFPAWSLAGGRSVYTKEWQKPEIRSRVKAGVIHNLKYDRGGGNPANVVIISSSYDPSLNGMNLTQITSRFYPEMTIENAAETAIRLMLAGRHSCIYHCLNEADVRRIMKHPVGLIASDSHTVSPDEALPHPRNFGTFPRVLGHYVRELHLLTLAQAVHKMTGAVADRLNLHDRGTVTKGKWADIVVFDAEKIIDRATWSEPKQISEGIEYVLVNGKLVLDEGKPIDVKPGKFLKRENQKSGR